MIHLATVLLILTFDLIAAEPTWETEFSCDIVQTQAKIFSKSLAAEERDLTNATKFSSQYAQTDRPEYLYQVVFTNQQNQEIVAIKSSEGFNFEPFATADWVFAFEISKSAQSISIHATHGDDGTITTSEGFEIELTNCQ